MSVTERELLPAPAPAPSAEPSSSHLLPMEPVSQPGTNPGHEQLTAEDPEDLRRRFDDIVAEYHRPARESLPRRALSALGRLASRMIRHGDSDRVSEFAEPDTVSGPEEPDEDPLAMFDGDAPTPHVTPPQVSSEISTEDRVAAAGETQEAPVEASNNTDSPTVPIGLGHHALVGEISVPGASMEGQGEPAPPDHRTSMRSYEEFDKQLVALTEGVRHLESALAETQEAIVGSGLERSDLPPDPATTISDEEYSRAVAESRARLAGEGSPRQRMADDAVGAFTLRRLRAGGIDGSVLMAQDAVEQAKLLAARAEPWDGDSFFTPRPGQVPPQEVKAAMAAERSILDSSGSGRHAVEATRDRDIQV